MLRKENSLNGSSNILGINLDGDRLLVVYGSPTGTVYERLSAPIPAQANFAAVLELIMVQADRLLTLTQAQHLALPERVSLAISGNLDPETAFSVPLWTSPPGNRSRCVPSSRCALTCRWRWSRKPTRVR